MKNRILVLTTGLLAVASAGAVDVKWIGSSGGDWSDGANWEGGAKPGQNDTAVFSGENGTTYGVNIKIDGNLLGPTVGSIRVTGGTWCIGTSQRSSSAQRDAKFFLAGDGSGVSSFEIAEGAKLVCSNALMPTAGNTLVFQKTGAGALDYFGALGENNSSRRWASIVFRDASKTFRGGSSLATTNLVVGAGVDLTVDSGSYPYSVNGNPSVYLEAGATIRFYKERFDGIAGSGCVTGDGNNGYATLYLARGPYRFDGTVGKPKNVGLEFAAQGTVPDANYRFIVGSANGFESSSPVTFATGGIHPLKFASGIGSFTFHMLGGKVGAPLELVDVAGEPITLIVDRHSRGANGYDDYPGLCFTGAGTFITRHRINDGDNRYDFWGLSYTNDVFKGLTGTLGVETARGDLYIGDGTAAHDLDLSTVAAVKVKTSGALLKHQNVEKNVHSWTLDVVSGGTAAFATPVTLKGTVTGNGTLTFAGANSQVEDLRGSTSVSMSVQTSADVTLQAKDDAILNTVETTAAGASVVFSNGVFRGAYAANGDSEKYFNTWYPRGLFLCGRSSGTGRFVVADGATVWMRGSQAAGENPNYVEIRSGGTLCQNVCDYVLTTVDGHTIIFDGGTYFCGHAGLSYGSGQLPSNSENWLFQVGAGGGTIDYDFVAKFSLSENRGILNLRASFAPDPETGTSGAFHFRTPGCLVLYGPVALAGPVYLDEGVIRFNGSTANQTALADGTAFGTGDIHLGQALLDLGIYSSDLTPKLGANAGQTFYYDAGSFVVGRREGKAAQTVTFGNGSGAPFVRGGRGAALVLADREKQSVFDGSGAKFFAASGCTVALDAQTGLVDEPVFGYNYRTGATEFGAYTFLTYDETKGFVETSAYVTNDFTKGGVVTFDTADATLSADASVAALRIDAKRLTLAKDVTLKVGPDDSAKTAQILFNSKADSTWQGLNTGAIGGKGTLDFGASEAVLVSDRMDSGDSVTPGIRCRITGTGGLSIVGSPLHYESGFEIAGVNENTGDIHVSGTDLKVRNASALGSATVYVHGSRLGGGAVRFYTGGTYANEFYVDGHGPRRGENTTVDYGCLVFNAAVTLTGNIHIGRKARFGDTPAYTTTGGAGAKPGSATIAGVISGGKLDISGPDNSNYPTNRFNLCGANTYTGGTFIAFHNVWVSGSGTLGTGPVTLEKGAFVTFDYASAQTVSNAWNGFGTVRVVGAGELAFTGKVEPSAACSIKLDLAGTNPRLKGLPAFAAITNTAAAVSRLTLTGDATLGASQTFGGTNVRLFVDGATLDLNGRDLAFERVTCKNGGKVVNGTYTQTNPKRGVVFVLR